MVFVIPPKSEVGVLSPEIAGEGERVVYSDGETMVWNAPPPQPVFPDMSKIKSIARYFNRTGHQVWPAWVYHPTEEPRLLKNQDEGTELGICYREATSDERSRYGMKAVWDWQEGSLWRPTPYSGTLKFDPHKPGQGKTYIPSAPNRVNEQNELVKALIPEVAAAVAQALQKNGPSAPASVDAAQWEQFLQFQAYMKAQEAVEVVAQEISGDAGNALSGDEQADEREMWESEARRLGLKVDGRWSLDRLKSEIEKAA